MGFEFRLDRVLQHRQYLLDREHHVLMAAREREREAKARLQALESRIREDREQWVRDQSNGMDVATYLAYKDHVQALEKRSHGFTREWQKACDEMERQQQIVLEREKAVKVLEKLRHRYREDYLLECSRRDQKKLDEIVICKSHRDVEDV